MKLYINNKEAELLDLLNDSSYYRDEDPNVEGISTGREWYDILTDVKDVADDTYLVSVEDPTN